ncbi:MAG: 16S rRNA (adenine(1518)-N(6)/adenine(1519)-N(6))-dimethyltransferase RsmA [Clostridia bacterium]|nr:16S rRNA (adenine(1518)-N(6)/adenine(1519)-N(6))-dimethyltransferase RsmA [Clostridia bacterium]MDD4686062.1 16S rRNA (adenine(1518)-N(6)/adenine(1519)-N(6))-dimethyltransferase RsmA [Clostridia bacterium]
MSFKDIKFNKKFGQNFISDTNLLNAIVSDSGIGENDEVLEIGAGAGTLTQAISKKAKNVVAYEIDKKLTEILQEKFSSVKNVKIIMADILKKHMQEIETDFSGSFHIIANLPYYITTPLIFKFLEQTNKVETLTIMVQKEVAEKIVARPNEDNYGLLSAMISYYCNAKITRIVKKTMFRPRPKVDSAILRLERKPDIIYDENFTRFIKGCFAMKRKTLINNLINIKYNKLEVEKAFNKLNISLLVRAEVLDILQLRQLYQQLDKS